jgi:hypothetical protein
VARQRRVKRGTEIALSGPATRGTTVSIRGKPIKLPDDAYVESVVARTSCGVGMPCSETPLILIRRGDSTISLSGGSGTILRETVAPGQEQAFAFLKDALR